MGSDLERREKRPGAIQNREKRPSTNIQIQFDESPDPMSEAALRRARLAFVYAILGALNALVVYVLLQI
jgi:hypothetical protein